MLMVMIDLFSDLKNLKFENKSMVLFLQKTFEHSTDNFLNFGPFPNVEELHVITKSNRSATFFQSLPIIFPNVKIFIYQNEIFSIKHESKILDTIQKFRDLEKINYFDLRMLSDDEKKKIIIESISASRARNYATRSPKKTKTLDTFMCALSIKK